MGRSLVSGFQVQPQYLKDLVWPSLFTSSPHRLHYNDLLCCISYVFDKQGSIKVCLSLHCSHIYPALISKVTWLMDIWEQWPDVAPLMLPGTATANVLTLFSCCIKWHHHLPVKAAQEKDWWVVTRCRIGVRWFSALMLSMMSVSLSTWPWLGIWFDSDKLLGCWGADLQTGATKTLFSHQRSFVYFWDSTNCTITDDTREARDTKDPCDRGGRETAGWRDTQSDRQAK